ncbi:MAG: hypothetical protein ACFB20_06290 [Opitutales bacterium]
MKRFYRLLKANELFLEAWALGASMVTVVLFREMASAMPPWEACLRSVFVGCLSVGMCLLGISAMARRCRQFWDLWHPPAPRH